MENNPVYIKRKIDAKIQEYLKYPEILAIVGPRQSGKTTYLKHLLLHRKGNFISFEDAEILALFNHDLKKFINLHLKDVDLLCIDEFQYAKNGGKNLKYIFDTYPNKKIIISGSSAIDLTIHAIKFLVGRIIVVNFWPFDLDELKIVFPDFSEKEIIEYYGKFGGYPRVAISQNDDERKIVLRNIYNTYFLREVKDILGLVDDFKIQRLLTYLATGVGSQINYSSLASECELDERSIRKYLEFLNKTFVTYLVKPFYTNKIKEIVKQPKTYFFDAGFLNHILSYDVDPGKKLEQILVMEFIKKGYELKYWKNKQKQEMDFVIFKDNIVVRAVESKNSGKKTDSFRAFVKNYPGISASVISKENLASNLLIF